MGYRYKLISTKNKKGALPIQYVVTSDLPIRYGSPRQSCQYSTVCVGKIANMVHRVINIANHILF